MPGRDSYEQVRSHYNALLSEHYTWMFGGSRAKHDANLHLFARLLGRSGDGNSSGGSIGGAQQLAHDSVPGDFVRPGDVAVDLGAGSGFQTIPLLKLGYRVVAVDACEPLLNELAADAARQPESADFRYSLIVGDLVDFHLLLERHLQQAVAEVGSLGASSPESKEFGGSSARNDREEQHAATETDSSRGGSNNLNNHNGNGNGVIVGAAEVNPPLPYSSPSPCAAALAAASSSSPALVRIVDAVNSRPSSPSFSSSPSSSFASSSSSTTTTAAATTTTTTATTAAATAKGLSAMNGVSQSSLLLAESTDRDTGDITRSVTLIVCMGDTLTHLSSIADIENLFSTSMSLLRPGGKMILQFRDLTQPLHGVDRFIPVRSDERTVFTCFLEWEDAPQPSLFEDGSGCTIKVHDLVHVKKGIGAWELCKSWYRKLGISMACVSTLLKRAGFHLDVALDDGGMVLLVASKN